MSICVHNNNHWHRSADDKVINYLAFTFSVIHSHGLVIPILHENFIHFIFVLIKKFGDISIMNSRIRAINNGNRVRTDDNVPLTMKCCKIVLALFVSSFLF